MRRLASIAVLVAGVVVVLGAYTRLVDAGLGCPDWPGCYGFILVPQSPDRIAKAEARFPHAPVETHKAWPEMVHRYFASGLGLIILIGAVMAWRQRKDPEIPLKLPLALLALVILQGAFGAWTVTLKLWPQVVTAHLLGGFATLSLLWLLCLRLGGWFAIRLDPTAVPALRPLALVALVVVVLQIALGGWVSSNYAALACPDFPTCHGEWWPPLDMAKGFNFTQSVGPNYLGGLMESDARVTIQFFHRLGAVLVLAVVGLLFLRLWRAGSALAAPVLILLLLQLGLGITNVVAQLPLWVATAHNAGGALLLLGLVTVNYAAFRTRQAASTESESRPA